MASSIPEWLQAVDNLFRKRFCVNLIDLGWSENAKSQFALLEMTPDEFVDWFAVKYDLIEKSSFQFNPARQYSSQFSATKPLASD